MINGCKGIFKKTGENQVFDIYLILACFFMHSSFGVRDPISIKKALSGVRSNLLLHVSIHPLSAYISYRRIVDSCLSFQIVFIEWVTFTK